MNNPDGDYPGVIQEMASAFFALVAVVVIALFIPQLVTEWVYS